MQQLTLEEPHSATILIVDDDEASLYVKRRLLSRHGYRVVEASTGTEALLLAGTTRPDVVMLDINLPDLTGFDVCRQLKKQPETRFMKVLLTSAFRIGAPDRIRGFDVGADAYLIEPAEEEELISIVRALLTVVHHERDKQRLIDKLTSTQDQLLEATKAARFGVWDWNIPTGTLEWFGAHEELAGMRPGGFNGKIQAFTDVLHPEDRDRVWHRLQDLMSRHETDYADDYRFIHPDGTVHWMSGTGRLYYDEHGQAVRMIGVVQDISDRKRTEENLRESEARFRTMAEAVPSFLFETDAEGWNIWTSESWCRFTGQTPDQVAGHGWAEALHPEDRAANIDRWVHCMEQGVPFESQQRLRRADGTYAWVIARALPVRNDQGVINRWVGSVTDVDDIVRAQDALRESKNRLEALVTSAMDAVITIDGDQRIILFNPAAERMFGCLAEDVQGSSIDRFIPGRFESTHRAHVQQFRKDGTTRRRMGVLGTLSGVRANGEEFPIEASISQMVSGGTHLFTVILRDISDRKRAEDALQQRHRQLELLALASQRLLHGGDSEEELLESIFLDIAKLVDMDMFYHYRPGEDARMLRLQLSGGITEKERTQFATMGFGELLCGRVAERRERILVEDLQHSPHPGSDVLRAAGATSYAGFPLVASGQLVGTIAFVSNRRTHLCDGDIQMIQTICDQIATALERTKLQCELRENEERLRLALDGADLGSWDVDLKTDVAVWNRRHALLQGYEPETGPVSMDQWRKLVHPDDLDRVMAAIERAKREWTLLTEEHRLYRADTKEMRWLSLYGRFFYDENGEPERFSGVSFDVTQRKQAEETLRESEARYRAIFANAAVGIGRVAFHNATWIDVNEALCRLVGYSREEMLRTPWPNITHPDDLDLDLVPFQRMAAGRLDSYTVEKRFIHKLGHSVWARLTLSLVRDAAGHPLYEICIAEDIQERKWAESILMDTQERLEHWNQELERAVHEKTAELQQSHAQLRALASELTLTEHRERKRLATELHDHLQQMLVVGKLTIGQGKRHAIGMPHCEAVFKKVDDILAEALTYSRTLVAELSPPVLRDYGLVIGVRWLVDYMKQKHEHSVTVLVPEGTEVEVSEDHTLLLFQSVRELLINSAKHAGTGEATVTLEDQEGHLVITVSDTGNGFDLAAAAAGSPNGGLSSKFGLFSIQERMRALGGIFDIQSAPGQGTIARLTLPLGGRSSEAATDDPGLTTDLSLSKDSTFSPQSSTSTQDSRIRVLLVDDHTLVRQSLGAMLNGYPDMAIVGEAANGEEAVRLAEELHPAVVVMDINMPKMDGIEATGRITNRHPDIAVIGLSVNAGGENQEAMSHAGAVRLMTKESAMEELHSAIQAAVRR